MGRKNTGFENLKFKNTVFAIVLFVAGILLTVALWVKDDKTSIENNVIERLDDDRSIRLVAKSGYGSENMEIDVYSLFLNENEVEELYEKYREIIFEELPGENETLESVSGKLSLVDSINGYPFVTEYTIRPRGVIDENGEINFELVENTDIEISIVSTYEDYEFTETLNGHVIIDSLPDEERFRRNLHKRVKEANDQRTDNLILPSNIDGEEITWKEKKSPDKLLIPVLFTGISVWFLLKNRYENYEKKKKTKEKTASEYPYFAIKYSLLAGAGLSHRQILERIVTDYGNREGNPIYDEMIVTLSQVKSGISLTDAYSNMADRCGVSELTQFISLINQNIQKGGNNLANDLKKEALESVKQKRKEVRIKAETASTKLLFPMMIQLIIVFALIMIPAFGSMKF